MKQYIFIKQTFFCLLMIWSGIGFSQRQAIDKIVAQIGDEVIFLSDVQKQRLQMIQAEVPIDSNTDCDILEGLLYQRLLLHQAKLDSVEVSPDRVNAEMDQRLRAIASEMGGMQALEEYFPASSSKFSPSFNKS